MWVFFLLLAVVFTIIMLVESDLDIFSVDSSKQGSWTNIAPEKIRKMAVLFNIFPLFILVISWGVGAFEAAVGYLVFYLFWSIAWLLESHDRSFPLAVIDAVGRGGIKVLQTVVGVIIGGIFFVLNYQYGFMAVSSSFFSVKGIGLAGTVILGLALAVSIPISEEGFFRGFWCPSIAEVAGGVSAIVFTALIFGIAHLYLPLYEASFSVFAFSFVFGLVAGIATVLTKTIQIPLTAHTLFNALTFATATAVAGRIVLGVSLSFIVFSTIIFSTTSMEDII